MAFSSNEEIDRLARAFENRALPKEKWTHAAHLVVALYYCYQHPFGIARNLMRDGIYWLNDAHGTANTISSGYHETLTIFWLLIVSEFIDKNGRDRPIFELANLLIDEVDDSRLPLQFYSRELLFSVTARRSFVAPDLKKLSVSSEHIVSP